MTITVNQYDSAAPLLADGTSITETASQSSAQTSAVQVLADVSKDKETIILHLERVKQYIANNPWPA